MIEVKAHFKGKQVLVTGGTGLIGRQLLDLLVGCDAKVCSCSLDNIAPPHQVISVVNNNLCHKDQCETLINRTHWDYVFHLAGIKASPDITIRHPYTMSIPALMMNTNLIEACKSNSVGKVLFASSIGAYAKAEILTEKDAYAGEPMDVMPGWVKRMAELQIRAFEQEFGQNKFVVVRLANCYGPGDNFDPDNGMFISSLIAKVYRGDNPVKVWGDGSAIRDFLYSKDAALGILQTMAYAKDSWPVNIATGQGYSVAQVVDMLHRVTDDDMKFHWVFDTSMPSGAPKRVMDIAKARSLGFEPQTTMYQGLKETWEWYLAHPDEYLMRKNYFKENDFDSRTN